MTIIADLFELPERVHQGDFVLRLAEGVERPDRTLRDYVVTPQLVRCFEDALSLIGGAVGERTSKGAYLHGSFGSGKSHFMAVLTLLLRGDTGARATPELAGAVAKANAWTTGRRFLVVPYHMIGATSMESGLMDQGRRKGNRTGRYLILGSASMDLLRQSGESLAGRIEYIKLNPLDVFEAPAEANAMRTLWVRGGFPDISLPAAKPTASPSVTPARTGRTRHSGGGRWSSWRRT